MNIIINLVDKNMDQLLQNTLNNCTHIYNSPYNYETKINANEKVFPFI